MEKLKDIKTKHNHTLTDILKVLIFSLVMLAPFGAVLSKCLYTTFNKNAKDSYYGETINEYNNITLTDLSDFKSGKTYTFTSNNVVTSNSTAKKIYYNNLQIIGTNIPQANIDNLMTCNAFSTTFYGSNAYLVAFDDSTEYTICDMGQNSIVFTFVLDYETHPSNYTYTQLWDNFLTYKEYNKYSYIDNSFYYAVDELSDQPLFSWTKNTFIYSTINQMTTGLDFGNNNVLALLLTYWILNTMIYIIFDIVIEIFKKLTHALN